MGKKKSEDMFFGIMCNDGQQVLKEAIMNPENQVIAVNAVAGSGKTLIATACARLLCAHEDFDGALYIFATPSEDVLGFRPGSAAEKESDYLEPLYDALLKINENPRQAISSDISEKNGTAWIQARSATFMRGINLERKVVIIDECQNFTVPLIKRIISRCHDNCKLILLGCTAQTDISVSKSCFSQLLKHMQTFDSYVECQLPVSYRGHLAEHIDKL